MSAIPPKPEAPDELDKLFSDFFKAQLKHPWPNAPLPAGGAATSATEPSELVHTRTESPRNSPTPAPQAHAKHHDSTARARFTLAASVALALGGCWILANSFTPGERSNATPVVPGILNDSGADGSNHPTLKNMQDHKAKDNGGNDTGIKLDKIGEDKEE
jgi:hypothetical protein